VYEILKTRSNHNCSDTRVGERKVGARIVQCTLGKFVDQLVKLHLAISTFCCHYFQCPGVCHFIHSCGAFTTGCTELTHPTYPTRMGT
jgi:hypothetical protein